MNKILTLLVFTLFFSLSHAQVGIGTTTPNASLDVDSTTDGLLIPRISLTATNVATVITPTVSELVYNTNTSAVGSNQVTPGFYYWDGTLWIRLVTGNSNDWSLIGNAGTNPAINYLGTSDANDLILKTDAIDRVHIDTDGNVGINEITPDSKLDIVNNNATGNSVEMTHPVSNASSALWVKNNGNSRALHAQNLDANSNIHVARFLQMGNGASADGVVIDMNSTTPASTSGLFINQSGLGFGEYVLLPASNSSSGILIDHFGSGDGLSVLQSGSGDGIYNDVIGGAGIINYMGNSNVGVLTSLETAGGTGEYIYLDSQNGTGVNVLATNNPANPSIGAGGDVYSFFTNVNTSSPTAAGTVFGSAFAANQYGVGHGIIINHSGTEGRNAEFNITNSANPDEAIFAISEGTGSVVVAQNQNNTLPAAINVGDFSYTGTDINDHVGVYGSSAPTAGFGIGVMGQGGWYGTFSLGDTGASGTKTFLIDHPLDPENKFLRHFSIESDEVLNIYRGTEVFDASGRVEVKLPEYYESINTNASYQLTPIGAPMNLFIEQEVNNGKFVIGGGVAGKKVSWILTAERNDPYLKQFPEKKRVELDKEESRAAKYLMPELYGQPKEKGMFYRKDKKQISTTKIEVSDLSEDNIKKVRKKKNIKSRKKAKKLKIED